MRSPCDRPDGQTLVLFDVDGTLAVPAQKAPQEIIDMLARLRERYVVGIVGAGDFKKQEGQLGGAPLVERLDYCFSENGVHAFRGSEEIHCKSIVDHLGAEKWAEFELGIQSVLDAEREKTAELLQIASSGASLADRSVFLERRQCTVNICPIGRTPTLSKEERGAYDAADKEDGLRRRVVAELVRRFGPDTPYAMTFSIGGQIGIDVCPCGWDKTFCLQFVPPEQFHTIHFFGDKTQEGGGDYEIYEHTRTIGHTVTSAEDTLKQVESLLLS